MSERPALTVLLLALLLGVQPVTTGLYLTSCRALRRGRLMCARAMVRDLYVPAEGARVMSRDGTVLPLALGIWFWSVCIALVAWTAVRKHGQ